MTNKSDKLAFFGGIPARKTPFAGPLIINKNEINAVMKVLRRNELSRFMGSPSADIEKQLTMTSMEAVNYNPQYFLFLGGREVRKYEADFSKYINVKYSISVNSATTGLSTALSACGVGPGDEVITTCLSFNATAMSILAVNAVPIFVDIDPNNYCLDPKNVEKNISKKTKAILVVHLLGNSADMDAILRISRKYKLKVIEDCAQSPGVKFKNRFVGTIGDIGVFSFQETKNISTGEGGMIVTGDSKLARKCRLIRNHGESVPDRNTPADELINIVGNNYRMTELTAAIGIEQLKKLDNNNRIRNRNSHYLADKLSNLPGLEIPQILNKKGNICHVFPMVYNAKQTKVSREIIIAALRAEGIPVGTGYTRLMPENPVFMKKIAYGAKGCPFKCSFYNKTVNYRKTDYPVAAKSIYDKFIWFYHVNRPNTLKDMDDVVRSFKKVFSNLDLLKDHKLKKTRTVYKW